MGAAKLFFISTVTGPFMSSKSVVLHIGAVEWLVTSVDSFLPFRGSPGCKQLVTLFAADLSGVFQLFKSSLSILFPYCQFQPYGIFRETKETYTF